jgi:hypothetical protein
VIDELDASTKLLEVIEDGLDIRGVVTVVNQHDLEILELLGLDVAQCLPQERRAVPRSDHDGNERVGAGTLHPPSVSALDVG